MADALDPTTATLDPSPARSSGRLSDAAAKIREVVDRNPRAVAVTGLGAYVAFLIVSYIWLVSPYYFYLGMVNLSVADGSLTVAVALAWLPALAMPLKLERPYHLAVWLIYLLTYVPSQILPHFVLGDGWSILPLNLAIAGGMAILLAGERISPIRIPRPELSEGWYVLLLAAGAAVLLGISVAAFGIRAEVPSITDVTGVRDDYRDEVGASSPMVAYAVAWAGRVVLPVAIAIGIWWGRWWLVGAALVGELYIYSVTGFRSLILSVGLVVGIILLVRLIRAHWGALLPIIAAAGIMVASIPALIGMRLPLSLFVRRLLDVPGQLTGYYFDYFSTQQPYLLSHSVLGWLFEQPQVAEPPRAIGLEYFHDPRVNANGNLWADGMANFGLPGILLISVIAVGVLVAMDAASRGRPLGLAAAILGATLISLTNSGLLTSLGTHGIALAIVLVALLPGAGSAAPGMPTETVAA